ncbi:MAG TPA: tRNA (adenosine(37)-N6)-threonylcarbamoyltransferase complex ATPase subunit type 1 TsaE [Candidatus Babeliales bacterium]|jgi:tRNA threonylcarbamoyladenosine biosynthesis protein TsaE|nr:tRNA (adenosine(37)-N6)-threonylcarbamoyltransferase complex ATPase subunit type 1 TsaE [Candidatus Babeliales bacterium]
MKKHIITYTVNQIDQLITYIQEAMNSCFVITLQGPLGAGKTFLVKELLRACGIDKHIQSPTFSYMHIYQNNEGYTFYHFDLYRMQDIQQFKRAGFEEYLYQPYSWAIIEWPEIIKPLLSHGVCKINIEYNASDEYSRTATIYKY